MANLVRTLKVGCVGSDVFAAKRIINKRLKAGTVKPGPVARTFGVFFRNKVIKVQGLEKMLQTGQFNQALLDRMRKEGCVDAYSEYLIAEYAKQHPPRPPLVEPKQGFNSLHKSLWNAYSLARNMGMSDEGTYNPASRLPSGAPSDHAVYPAMAFDVGFYPATGYDNPTARKFFNSMVGRAEVEYVICGNKIWSKARGLHSYTYGGHESHVHVSGWR